MTTNRYTIANLASKTDMLSFGHTPVEYAAAVKQCDEWQTENPTGQYVIIEIKVVHVGRGRVS